MLYLTIRRTGCLQDAEEIVQDAFLSLYKKKGKLEGSVVAYLKAVIKNKIFNYYAEQQKELKLLTTLNKTSPKNQASVIDHLAMKETQTSIEHQVSLLPVQCRNVFKMSRTDELSNKEIAKILNISVKAVEAHITKALKLLRQNMRYHLDLIFVFLIFVSEQLTK